MKEDFTVLALIVDRSGSMTSIQEDTIGGINSFIKQHKSDVGENEEVKVTIAQFDHEYQVPFDFVDIKDVPTFTSADFSPRGSTALLDAIGKTIIDMGQKFSDMSEDERPSKVIVAVITDGYENSSFEFRDPKVIAEIVKKQEEDYNWDILFLGAGLDAVDIAQSYGFTSGKSMSYSTKDMNMAFDTMAASTLRSKAGDSADFTSEERTLNSQ